MSEYIRKFKPPKISKADLEKGIRYIDPVPQVDYLGQNVVPGDIVIYTKGYSGTPDLVACKVIGLSTKVTPHAQSPEGSYQSHGITVIYFETWSNAIRRVTTYSSQIVKILESQYTEDIKEKLIPA